MKTKEHILDFWFKELSSEDWFSKNSELDLKIKEQFSSVHQAAIAGELWGWRATRDGALAEIIVIDQFSRQLFRNDPRSYAYDGIALVLAQQAVSRGYLDELSPEKAAFMLMPYMHSESLVIHEQAVKLFSSPGLEDNLKYEHMHKVILERFNRYPHRNASLGRQSTPEELAFLQEEGSSF